MAKRWASFCVAVFGLQLAFDAQAAELTWTAPQGCPPAETVTHDLEELAGIALAGAPGLRFVAQVEERGQARWFVTLQTTDTDSSTGTRTIQGTSCDDVSRAAVVAMALAINAIVEARVPASHPTAKPEKSKPRRALEPVDDSDAVDPPEPRRAGPPPRGLLQLGVLLDGVALPELAAGATLAGGMGFGDMRLLLGGKLIPFRETSQGAVGARFLLASGNLSGCYRIGLDGWSFLPCLSYELGALQGEGVRLTTPRTRTALWQAAEAELGVALPLGSQFELNLAGSLVVPLNRPSFVLDAAVPVHEVPALGARGYGRVTWFIGATATEKVGRGQSNQ
jgi:hypothetical protein